MNANLLKIWLQNPPCRQTLWNHIQQFSPEFQNWNFSFRSIVLSKEFSNAKHLDISLRIYIGVQTCISLHTIASFSQQYQSNSFCDLIKTLSWKLLTKNENEKTKPALMFLLHLSKSDPDRMNRIFSQWTSVNDPLFTFDLTLWVDLNVN